MSSSAPTLALYRLRIPAHKGVSDDLIRDHLADAIEAHTETEWGQRYDLALVLWAAHQIERTPGSGANGDTASEAGAIVAQSDSQSDTGRSSSLSRSYASPSVRSPEDTELATTRYGLRYLAIRDSRAAAGPYALGPG